MNPHQDAMMPEPNESVNLLWTGGWDSTFRLLELVLHHRASVQPFYLIHGNRSSTMTELETMGRIRKLVFDVSSEAAELVKPLTITPIWEIAPDPDISAQHARLQTRGHVGPQYKWLARMAKQRRLNGLELGVIAGGRIALFLDGHVRPTGSTGSWELEDDVLSTDLAFFRFFHFPVLHLTKPDMQRIAQEHGFGEIMEHTWFCHSPFLGKPCGMCPPCQYTREGGMGRRIPRIRSSPLYRGAWNMLKAGRSLVLRHPPGA